MQRPAHSKKLLAINFGGLGDEVLFLPTLQSIKLEHPEWHLTLLTEPRGKSIADVSDLIDDSLTFDIKKRPLLPADYLHLLQLLRGGRFDIVVSSGASPQVSALLFLSGIGKRIGYGASKAAQLLLTNPVPLQREQHAACMYHDLTKGLGIERSCARPQVKVDLHSKERMHSLLQEGGTVSGGKRTILLHPGTSRLALQKGIIKTWDPLNWSLLVSRLAEEAGCRVVVAGGPDDEETIKAIFAQIERNSPELISKPDRLLNAYGRTRSVQDLVALIALSDLLICVDSAPMHLGVGVDKALVALFGPTDPAKLLWTDKRFLALRDPEAAKRWGNADPFTQRPAPSQGPTEPYVQIPPDTVFRTAMDQLNSMSVP